MENEKKKYVIYVVLDIYPCATGGMEIFYNKHLKEICDKTKIALITCCTQFSIQNCRNFIIPRRIFNIKGSGRIAKLLFTSLKLIKHKNEIKYIHLPYTSTSGNWGIIFPILRTFFGLKYIIYIHAGGMRKWKKLGFDRLLFRYSEKIIAVSEEIKKEYERRSQRDINIVFPIDSFNKEIRSKEIIRKNLGLSSSDKVCLYVGSLKSLKNPNILLSSFIALGLDFLRKESLKLFFVGDGPLRNSLEKQVNDLNAAPFVIFTGQIPNENIPQFYKIANYYIIPSKFEGTSISLVEAMFNQLPIVGAAVNGIQNIIIHKETGLLFESGNTNHLKEQIMFLLNNTKKAESLATNAQKEYTLRFSNHLANDCFLDIYSN